MSNNESTPLISSGLGQKNRSSSKNESDFYFVRKAGSDSVLLNSGNEESHNNENITDSVKKDVEQVLNVLPQGTEASQFSSRPVNIKSQPKRTLSLTRKNPTPDKNIQKNNTTLIRPRKVPIKVEPKVFFANERTFLAWLHISVYLAGASIAILAFAEDRNPWSQMYGIVLLPVAIAFIVYALNQYMKRADMIRRRDPGPYEDIKGPTVLALMLMVSITIQFAIKLYSIM